LPPDRFLRIHRSYIVNIAAIKELCSAGAGEYLVSLRCGKQLPVGPNYTESVQKRLLRGDGGYSRISRLTQS
jgi:two-component system LytT family response regulator